MMWVIFYTLNNFTDDYMIRETEAEAEAELAKLMQDENVYAAGIGPVTNSTEHWHVRRDH